MPPPEISIANEQVLVENEKLNHRVVRQAFFFDSQHYLLRIGEGLGTIEQLNKVIVSFSFTLMVLFMVVSVFIDIGFARFMLRPFNRIVKQKLQLPRNPSMYVFNPIKTTTYEFKYLDDSINELMRKTRDAFLIEKEFIANVAHELLTPISILQNRFENMLLSSELPEEAENRILESLKTLKRLGKIIKALLMISKIENDQYLKQDSISLQSLIDEVLEELEDLVSEKQLVLVKSLESDFILSPVNKSLLFNMIFNLVNNAIRYNNIAGNIFIRGERTDGGYKLQIQDTGIGMEPNQVAYAFDRFKRFNPSDEKGYGLGLPIVKTIADFHGVGVEIESSPMKGATVTLFFPNKSA
jgi:signal transduction histidine kinase